MVELRNSKNTYITNNDDLGNRTCEHDPDDGNFYQYVTRIEVPGGKRNCSTAIPTDLESNASSSESGAKTSVTPNIASVNNINIKAKHVTLHIAN